MTERTQTRLGQEMDARRVELGMSWKQLARAAGDLAISTIDAYRFGDRKPSAVKRAQLEDALEWERGSIDQVLAGGEAVPRARPSGDDNDVSVLQSKLDEVLDRLRRIEDEMAADDQKDHRRQA